MKFIHSPTSRLKKVSNIALNWMRHSIRKCTDPGLLFGGLFCSSALTFTILFAVYSTEMFCLCLLVFTSVPIVFIIS